MCSFSLAPAVQLAVAIVGATDAAAGRFQRPDPARHQARAGLLHHQPDRLHVPGPGRGGLVGGHLSFHDPCLFQSAALSGRRRASSCAWTASTTCSRWGDCERNSLYVFWTFLIGASSLAALPLVTAGFYSKDLILWRGLGSALVRQPLAVGRCGLLGAVLTSLYTFRMVFLTFSALPSRWF